MAEALFRKAIAGRPEYTVKSAGVSASNGAACSQETAQICQQHDAPLEGFKSQLISPKLLEEATHVFAMTRGHLAVLEKHFPEFSDKYYLACEFVDLPGLGLSADVPDPIGMGRRAYLEVADVLQLAIPSIIAYIDQTSSE